MMMVAVQRGISKETNTFLLSNTIRPIYNIYCYFTVCMFTQDTDGLIIVNLGFTHATMATPASPVRSLGTA
jgi:hypothetical protein